MKNTFTHQHSVALSGRLLAGLTGHWCFHEQWKAALYQLLCSRLCLGGALCKIWKWSWFWARLRSSDFTVILFSCCGTVGEQRRKRTWRVWGEEKGGEQDLHVFRCPVQQDLHFPRVLFPPGYYLNTHIRTHTNEDKVLLITIKDIGHTSPVLASLHWLSTVWGVGLDKPPHHICELLCPLFTMRPEVWRSRPFGWEPKWLSCCSCSSLWNVVLYSHKTTSADSLNLCTLLSNACSCSVNLIFCCFYCLISVLPECVVLSLWFTFLHPAPTV